MSTCPHMVLLKPLFSNRTHVKDFPQNDDLQTEKNENKKYQKFSLFLSAPRAGRFFPTRWTSSNIIVLFEEGPEPGDGPRPGDRRDRGDRWSTGAGHWRPMVGPGVHAPVIFSLSCTYCSGDYIPPTMVILDTTGERPWNYFSSIISLRSFVAVNPSLSGNEMFCW